MSTSPLESGTLGVEGDGTWDPCTEVVLGVRPVSLVRRRRLCRDLSTTGVGTVPSPSGLTTKRIPVWGPHPVNSPQGRQDRCDPTTPSSPPEKGTSQGLRTPRRGSVRAPWCPDGTRGWDQEVRGDRSPSRTWSPRTDLVTVVTPLFVTPRSLVGRSPARSRVSRPVCCPLGLRRPRERDGTSRTASRTPRGRCRGRMNGILTSLLRS